MFPTLGTVSQFAFDQSIDRFSVKVEIQVPPNIAHVQLTLEKFGRSAHAPNLIEPEAGPASLGVYGSGTNQATSMALTPSEVESGHSVTTRPYGSKVFSK